MNKKELRAQVQSKIEAALAEFAKGVSEKKFKKHAKKAARIISDGLSVTAKKGKAAGKKVKVVAKKAVVKKAKKAATASKTN